MQHYMLHIFKCCCRLAIHSFAFSLIIFSISVPCRSQDSVVSPGIRQEVWPELDIYYRFNKTFRLFASYSATQLRTSSYTDGGLSVNLDYFALPIWRGDTESKGDSARGHFLWFRGGFTYSYSPKHAEKYLREYNILTEASVLFHLPYKLLLTERNRFDWRWRNDNFQPRYRARLRLERAFKTNYLSFRVYTYGEYFVNFDSDINNRMRLALGWEVRASKHLNFETYFVHQFEGGNSEVPGVNAIGLMVKFYFMKGDPLFAKK